MSALAEWYSWPKARAQACRPSPDSAVLALGWLWVAGRIAKEQRKRTV